jgi:hypothetical protein
VSLQPAGPLLALVTFATIGTGHVLVRRLHARFGTWPAYPLFLLAGLGLYVSTVTDSDLISGMLGISAITLAWDGIELFRQEKRTQRERSR